MMERHLFDMIPGAWKDLGKTVIPPPVLKPIPASATSTRRMSLPVQRTKRVFASAHLPVHTSGPITRRMSIFMERTEGSNTEIIMKTNPKANTNKTIETITNFPEKLKNVAAYRRASIQCEPSFITRSRSEFVEVKKSKYFSSILLFHSC